MSGLASGLGNRLITRWALLLAVSALGAPAAPVPRIEKFTPAVAPVGAPVTLTGTNFSSIPSENIVFFGPVRGLVADANPTNLTVKVPPGAAFGRIIVTVNGLTATTLQPFLPTFSGDLSSVHTDTFAPGFNLPTGHYPTPVVVGDVDLDGWPDLIVGNGQDYSVSVYRSIVTNAALSASSFAPPVNFSASLNPYKLTMADVDGDGRPDLIASGVNSGQIVIWRNTSIPGNITNDSFASPILLQTGADSRFACAADLDGDGRIDMVSVNYGDSTISLFRNIGSPGALSADSFASRVDLRTGSGPYGMDIGDLDGDGRPDLAVVNMGSSISLFRNICTNGILDSESFAARVDLPAPADGDSIAIADVDGDGKPDLVTGHVHPLLMAVFRNQSASGDLGTNSFAQVVSFSTGNWVHNVALADFNGDGKPDIATAGELPSYISVFQNLSTPGIFDVNSLATRVDLPSGWNAWGLALNDLDGDGRPDLAFANTYDNTVTLYHNILPFAGPPVILVQPTNQIVAFGEPAVLALQATGSADIVFQWWKGVSPLEGATNSEYLVTAAQSSDAGDYFAVLTNAYGAVTSSVAMVVVTNLAPYITTQPQSRNVLLNGKTEFQVKAGGNRPLSYQWRFNGTNLPGAFDSTLSLTNVQLRDAGIYAVEVSNSLGTMLSSNAVLNVITPPANILVRDTNTPSGWPVSVPVLLVANGNENAVSFSLSFLTQSRNQLLQFLNISLGGSASGASLLINTNFLATGLLGVAIALPAGEVFSSGTQEVARVTFDTSVITFEQLTSTVLSFGDTPIPRQVTDAGANSLPYVFTAGRIFLIPSDIEGDASPRPTGNRSITLNDWVQAGRFAAGLDAPADGTEFQRADCAPRSTRGDGQIKVTDWVQTGRYYGKLDPLTAVGGPLIPLAGKLLPGAGPVEGPGIRQVLLGSASVAPGVTFELPVFLCAQGDENALGFSLSFNPSQLEFRSVVAGANSGGSSMNLNSLRPGSLGFVLALPTGAVFPAGTQEVARVSFVSTPQTTGSVPLAFGDAPVLRAVSDSAAAELPSEYLSGSVQVQSPPALRITLSGSEATISWPIWARGYVLQSCVDLQSAGWTNMPFLLLTNETDVTATVPLTGELRLFRLSAP